MDETSLDIALALQAAWADAFAQRDADALAALYAPQTAFYGSTATLHTDPNGVRSYFTTLSASFIRARFGVPHIVQLGHDAFVASGDAVFVKIIEGRETDLCYRLTHVLVRQHGGGWQIAAHHASPRPQ
jgi:uncharacterized protein (TIGR02246 family)